MFYIHYVVVLILKKSPFFRLNIFYMQCSIYEHPFTFSRSETYFSFHCKSKIFGRPKILKKSKFGLFRGFRALNFVLYYKMTLKYSIFCLNSKKINYLHSFEIFSPLLLQILLILEIFNDLFYIKTTRSCSKFIISYVSNSIFCKGFIYIAI